MEFRITQEAVIKIPSNWKARFFSIWTGQAFSLLGLTLIGVGMIGMGFAPPSLFGLAVGMAFVIGVGNPITNGPLFAVLQDVVAPEMQGRVLSRIMSMAAAMTPLGLVIAGPLADRLGVQSWFIIGGVSTLLMAVGGLFIPAIMNLEQGRKPSLIVTAPIPGVVSEPVNPGD